MVFLLVLLTWLEASEPDELNWSPSYSAEDKIPLGSYVLYENLKEQDLSVKAVDFPPFDFLKDSLQNGTYFFLNNEINIHDSELKRLLSWVERGNTAFLSAERFSPNLLDTLKIKVGLATPKGGFSSKPRLNLTDLNLKKEQAFLYNKETYHFVIKEYDTLNQMVLGVSGLEADSLEIKDPAINFVMDSIGKGAIFLHTTPQAFSNYFLLYEENVAYAERALGYLPKGKDLFWDQYYKAGKAYNTSPLFVLLRFKQLKWAYYFMFIGGILFIIFAGKRKQRSIPVVNPLQNQSYHFTRTVAGLYLKTGEYKTITSKQIILFLDYIRTKYRIPTDQVNEEFYRQLAGLSNNSVKEVKELWRLMATIEEKEQVSKEELLKLNKAIKAFKKDENGK